MVKPNWKKLVETDIKTAIELANEYSELSTKYSLWLVDIDDNILLFGYYPTIQECRDTWCKVARYSRHALVGFKVFENDGNEPYKPAAYEGSFVTDEC